MTDTRAPREWLRTSIRSFARLWNVPIRSRLFMGFVALTLLTGTICVIAIRDSQALSHTAADLNSRDIPEVVTLGTIEVALLQEHNVALELSDQAIPGIIQQMIRMRAPLATQTHIFMRDESVQGNHSPAADTAQVSALIAELTALDSQMGHLASLYQAGQDAEAATLIKTQIDPQAQHSMTGIVALSVSEQQEALVASQQMQRDSTSEQWLLILILALAAVVAGAFALVVARSLTRPLAQLLEATETMTRGNLSTPMRMARGDEIGQLANAFETMRQHLRATMTELAASQRQTQAIIDATADGVLVVDARLRVIEMNPAAQQLCGWQAEEARGELFERILGCRHPAFDDLAGREPAAICPGQVQPEMAALAPQVYQARLRDGRTRWFRVSCATISRALPEAGKGYVVGIQDITRVMAVEQMQTDFVAMISHELRAPLTTVSSAVELLGQLSPDSDPETYHEVAHILAQQTARLRHVIEAVLQLTRFQAGKFTIHAHPVALAEVVGNIVARVHSQWVGDDHTLELRMDDPHLAAQADPALLEIILLNLLDNAHNYADAGAAIEVELSQVDAAARIAVSDHGPQIPPDQREAIFERFARGGSPAVQARHGYGLGLFLARELARAQGGDVRLDADYTAGARFLIELPLAPIAVTATTMVRMDESDERDNLND